MAKEKSSHYLSDSRDSISSRFDLMRRRNHCHDAAAKYTASNDPASDFERYRGAFSASFRCDHFAIADHRSDPHGRHRDRLVAGGWRPEWQFEFRHDYQHRRHHGDLFAEYDYDTR